ncbi:MAG: hypothetical protein ABI614_05655 [Planctomycetota bacterium]
MTIVLAFLLGMPLLAIPQISGQLPGLLRAKPQELVDRQQIAPPFGQAADEIDMSEAGTTVTMLASTRSQPSLVPRNPDALAAAIEELKTQFVAAGVTYMLLEQIGTDSVTYRFQFDVPVAAGSAYRERFQVIDEAPDAAMRQALTELQEWRGASREPAHLERPRVILR